MWKAKIHPAFRLQGRNKADKEAWKEEAKRLQEAEQDYIRSIGDFIADWLCETTTIRLTTSGSTGTPKPIYLKKKHMQASAEATAAYFALQAGSKALLCMPADFIAGKMMLVRAMQMGWELDYVKPSQNPLQASKTYDFVAMTPYQVHHSLKDIHKASVVLIGGGAVDTALHQQLQAIKTKAFASYGMTETCSHIALRAINGPEASSIYRATKAVRFRVDSRGCLLIDAPKVHDGELVTNDIVALKSDTSFVWKGRYDSVINSGGVKIHPEMLEETLATRISSPFFIGSLPDPILENKVVLLIENKEEMAEELLQKAFAKLPKYERPKEVFYLPEFLWTETGKIKRKATLKLLIENSCNNYLKTSTNKI